MNPLHKRIYEISYKNKLSHISSCISVCDIADKLFQNKEENDLIILSKGHGGLGFYVVLEKYLGINAEELLKKHGIHPKLDKENGILVSSGSLGQAITVAAGYALADKNRKVHCIISDGEWYEGSVFETLNFAQENYLYNFIIHIDCNFISAYKQAKSPALIFDISKRLFENIKCYLFSFKNLPFFCKNDLDYHYYILTDEDWNRIKNL